MKVPGLVKLSDLWDTLRTSYWFVPTIMAIASTALYAALQTLDTNLDKKLVYKLGWVFTGGPDGAREVLAVVAGSMITIAGVTFSITIVALTLASQQFGPFVLRNFMRDTGNQVVLGTFISTFIFCLLTLRTIRGTDRTTFVPHLSVSMACILAMCSLGVLIYFIHHVSAFIQASNMIFAVSQDLEQAVDRIFPERLGTVNETEPDTHWNKFVENADNAPVRSVEYGYIKAVDNDLLLRTAQENGLVVQMLKRPGKFVGKGDEIAFVQPGGSVNEEVESAINESLLLGPQRTTTQDVEFVFSQIVEVAVRSLSPGINDPFTAIICIDHLGQGLRRVADRSIPSPFRYDKKGALRVIAFPVTFSELVDSSFDQIRHYGRSNAAVLNSLLDTIGAVASHVGREEDLQVLQHHAELILKTASKGLKEEEAFAGIRSKCFATIESTGAKGYFCSAGLKEDSIFTAKQGKS
ncbi:DUF2254 domain-containing protein [Pelotalea chapellei]|uniref:DUF2254 domain-containing protein n=1 Tax=Pelotalea chapellei TaxID=44671 RepID=A0ABS5U3U2_9BACT|nr:DUF2254 domain-containing protein [Pelotalea chapellei]MBT1070341.1 DUF2254 domain-containing protein [Pelotalea chapellei]